MHELPITERILEIVLKHASGLTISKIARIHLKIGALSDLEDEWIQHYFDYISRGTLAEKAELVIRHVPIVVRCTACSDTFEVTREQLGHAPCPHCAESRTELVSGREYLVENMEVL